ncbi:hypothetical protein Pan44_42600 [Caulifigura coniformis]|uniref:Cna protein B-type domain protein n=1 Tax=Caulifigura coniformis TaxID=2527983 RepID=A0A517SJA9_9PLAN|nr:carboxypeptidase-like regulatory domain-containing protein [Caulifigura coniformis]QDT56208.1 hypothetical protein Pan44_42600 [Caulifigura coniformis]
MAKRSRIKRTATAAALAASWFCTSVDAAPIRGVLPGRSRASAAPEKKSTQMLDIALDDDRNLRGRFIDSEGAPIDGAIVTLRQSDRVIARSTTLHDGTFQIDRVPAGTYRLSCGAASGQIRCWPSEAAPPNAVVDGVTFQDSVVRGQAVALAPALFGSSAITAAASGVAIGGVATYAATETGSADRASGGIASENPPPPSPASDLEGQLVGRDPDGNLIRIEGPAPWEQNGPDGSTAPSTVTGVVLPSKWTKNDEILPRPASP